MRGLIDATRQARGDDKAGVAEIMRQLAGEFQAGAGSVAGADDRDHRPHQRLHRAAHAEQGRRIVERRQPRRITGFSGRDQIDAEPLACGKLSARILLAADARGVPHPRAAPDPAAAPALPVRCRNDSRANGMCAARHCRNGSAAANRSAGPR